MSGGCKGFVNPMLEYGTTKGVGFMVWIGTVILLDTFGSEPTPLRD